MTVIRDSALEWLKDEHERQEAIIESLTQELIEVKLERDAALAQIQQIQATRGERD